MTNHNSVEGENLEHRRVGSQAVAGPEATLSGEAKQRIGDKILYVLSLYPGISPVMLQMGLSPNVKARLWKPIMYEMIEQGLVRQETILAWSPSGQRRGYIKLYTTERGLVNFAMPRDIDLAAIKQASGAI